MRAGVAGALAGAFPQYSVHFVPEFARDDPLVLAGVGLAFVDRLTNINAVVQQAVDVILGDRFALLGGHTTRPQFPRQHRGAADLGKAIEHQPHGFGLGLAYDKPPVLDVIAQGHSAAHPHAFFARGSNFVANALAGDLAFELGEGEQDVQRQPPHRVVTADTAARPIRSSARAGRNRVCWPWRSMMTG